MSYWLLKSDPEAYSWEDMKKEKKTDWDGVRNYQARNFMKDMKKGDIALFYHSGNERSVIGTVEITKESYQDPTTDDDRWVAVEVTFGSQLNRPVTLKEIKADEKLSEIALIRQSRLSVMKLEDFEYKRILEIAQS